MRYRNIQRPNQQPIQRAAKTEAFTQYRGDTRLHYLALTLLFIHGVGKIL